MCPGANLRDNGERYSVEGSLLQEFIEQAQEGFALVDESGRIIIWNKAMERISGLLKREAIGREFWEVRAQLTPEQYQSPGLLEEIKNGVLRLLAGEKPGFLSRQIRAWLQRTDGAVRLLEQTVFLVQARNGNQLGVITRDVTEKHELDQKLQLLASIVETTLDGIVGLDQEGRIQTWNHGAEVIFEVDRTSALGLNIQDLPITFSSEFRRHLLEYLNREDAEIFEVEILTPKMARKQVSITFSPIFERGKATGGSLVIKDLSQLREAERHFKESEKRLRTIFNKASDLILIHRSSEEIIEVNSIADQLLGFSPEELKGKKLEEIVVPEERERLREFLSQLRKGEFSRIELQLRDRSGRRVPVEMNSHMLDEETIMSIGRDITQRKRAEELQADFIRAVVHDLGNPISAIKASLEMVPDSIKKGEKRDLIEIVHRNTERLHNLAHSLLTSIKLEAGELKLVKKEVNLSQFLLDFLLQQRPLAEQKSIEVISRIPSLPALIQGDPDRLGEIFSNILANSIKFTPHSGKIEISLEEKDGWAVVKISNNGPPISPEDQEHLFEKFYRGKSGMGGTGLGLYIARWLTEVHGGSISVESSEEGTTFTVKLPALKS